MSKTRIAIASTNRDKYSETFIHQHVQQLPGEIHFLTDGYLPTYSSVDLGASFNLIELASSQKFFRRLFKPSLEQSDVVVSYLKHNKIQVLLAEYGPAGAELLEVSKKSGVPLVVHFHGYDAYRNDVLTSYGKKYPALFKHAAAIIAVSQPMMDQLKQLGCPEEKLHLLPYGIDTQTFRLTERPNYDHLISCGRFVEKKAPHTLINVMELVLEKVPEATLTMIGNGPLLGSTQELAISKGIQQAITFAGALSQTEIARLYSRADVFVQHSISTVDGDAEGTPLAIMEAASSGLPVVATSHAGIPAVVKHNETGYLVEEGDQQQMAKYIIQLLQSQSNISSMGRQGSSFIQKHHQLVDYTNKLYSILCQSIS